MKLLLSALAEARELEIDLWWRQGRPDAPERFTEELLAPRAEITRQKLFWDKEACAARRLALQSQTRPWRTLS